MQHLFGALIIKLRFNRWRRYRGQQPIGPAASSVGEMLDELQWPTLEASRDQSSCFSSTRFIVGLCPGARDHPMLGPIFRPIPNAKKYGFSPIPDKKIPNLTKKIKKDFFVLHLYFIVYKYRTYCYIITISQNNRIQSHLLLSLPFLIVH